MDAHKSMGPDGICPKVLKELTNIIAGPCIIFQRSWESGNVPGQVEDGNVVPIFKKGKKEDPGNYRPASLTSVPGKTTEKVILRDSYQVLGGISWTTCSEVANIWDSLGLN